MQIGNTQIASLTIIRWLSTVVLGLLLLAWVSTWPMPFPALNRSSQTTQQPLFSRLDRAPSWRDLLVIDVTVDDPALQLRYAAIDWRTADGQLTSLQIRLRADGLSHRYLIPIGIEPAWLDGPTQVQLRLDEPVRDLVHIEGAQLITRPPWALDQALGALLMPVLVTVPPWENLLLLTGVLLGAALALLWPQGHWRGRLALLAVGLGGVAGLSAVVGLALNLSQLLPRLGPRSEAEAVRLAPSYSESPALTAALLDASAAMPAAPVLILDDDQESFLIARARYLLYPRRVDATLATRAPSRVSQLLREGGYSALISARAATRAPLPGWQQIGDDEAGLTIWADQSVRPLPPISSVAGPGALLGLLAGLLFVSLPGWAIARRLSDEPVLALSWGWGLGTIFLAWWMVALDWLNLPWAWWSIGLPLGLAGAALGGDPRLWQGWMRSRSHLPHVRWSWELLGGLLLGLLVVGVALQAVLLPFSDQDTWRMWALKGKAFFLDGAMAPVLRMYPQSDLHHAAYPPAHPLLLAWGYLSMGGLSERLVKMVFPVWYVACLLTVWGACRQWCSPRAAMGWTLLLATTPQMLDHATLGNADLPLATLLLMGTLALLRWLDTGATRWLWVGALLLSGAAWIKLDARAIGAGILAVAIGLRALAQARNRRPAGPELLLGALALGAFLLTLVPWIAYTRQLDLIDPTPGLAVLKTRGWDVVWEGARVMGEELLLSHNNSAGGLLGGGFGALWLVCVGAAAINGRALRHDAGLWLLALAVLGMLAAYLGVYALRPYFSIDRYVLHAVPLMVVLAVRTTSRTTSKGVLLPELAAEM